MTTTAPPALHLPTAALRAISRSVRTRAGEDGAGALRAAGAEIGRQLVEGIGDDVSTLSAEGFWTGLAERLGEAGWGRFSFTQPHPGIAVLESEDCVEADPEANLQHPGGHLTTGVVAAALDQAGESELSILEVTCRSAGGDRCRFAFGGSEALTRLHRALAAGNRFEDALGRLGEQG
jgi:predicted hydrocarbon binding protein